MAEPKKKWTSGELIALLRKRYEDTQRFAVLEQVGNGTGYRQSSWADAIVVNLWPSDGLLRVAYEVKVSRADFVREITTPSKNADFKKYCHAFWFIGPEEAIKEQELPEGAGWLKPRGEGLVIARAASVKQDPELNAGFLAALIRSTRKEETADVRRQQEKFYREDPTYQRYKRMSEVGEAFLTKRGQYSYGLDKDVTALAAAFERAGTDEAGAAVREQVDSVLRGFQSSMLENFERFAELAHISLTECDEAGRFVMRSYGGEARKLATTKARRKTDDFNERKDAANRELMADISKAHRREFLPDPISDQWDILPALEYKTLPRPDVHRKSPCREPQTAQTHAICPEHGPYQPTGIGCVDCELANTNAPFPLSIPLTAEALSPLCSQCGKTRATCPCPPE